MSEHLRSYVDANLDFDEEFQRVAESGMVFAERGALWIGRQHLLTRVRGRTMAREAYAIHQFGYAPKVGAQGLCRTRLLRSTYVILPGSDLVIGLAKIRATVVCVVDEATVVGCATTGVLRMELDAQMGRAVPLWNTYV